MADQPTPAPKDPSSKPSHESDINRSDPNNPSEPNRVGLHRDSVSPAQGINTGAIQPGRSGDGTAEQI